MVPKPKQELDERDRRNFQLNSRIVYTLQCAMASNEYNRICHANRLKKFGDYLK